MKAFEFSHFALKGHSTVFLSMKIRLLIMLITKLCDVFIGSVGALSDIITPNDVIVMSSGLP